jgi:hypothetical protein
MIVVWHPSKLRLTTDETKTAADRGMPQLGPPGHYFACGVCGNSGRIHTGPDSRLNAVLDARRHPCRKRKSEWRKLPDGHWTWTRYGIGFSYSCLGPHQLNIAIRAAALPRVLH